VGALRLLANGAGHGTAIPDKLMVQKTFIRTFIAIELPAEIKEAMAGVQAELRKSGADVGWVRPEGVHLTLKFLGDVEEVVVAGLGDALEDALKGEASFILQAKGVGTFPTPRAPRVIWLGVEGEVTRLSALAERVENVCAGLKFPAESRPFKAHLTLGRVKSPKGRDKLVKALEGFRDADLGEFKADAVSVMKSELRPSGAVYTEMRRIEFTT
ncbi:MAG: RNA 2',3'-cyclic phosphodiesterase, partial [Nitrospirota bacterium]